MSFMKIQNALEMLRIDKSFLRNYVLPARPSAATQIVIHGSRLAPDAIARTDALRPHYVIDRQGCIFAMHPEGRAPLGDHSISVCLINDGPRMRLGCNFYPVRYDSHHMPTPDDSQPCDPHPYEYCTQNRYRGFAWYQNYTTRQLQSLQSLLRSICFRHGIAVRVSPTMGEFNPHWSADFHGIFLASDIFKGVNLPHPSTDLINIIKSLAL